MLFQRTKWQGGWGALLVALLAGCQPVPPQPKLGSVAVVPERTPSNAVDTSAVQGLRTDAATVAGSLDAAPAARVVPAPASVHAAKLGKVAQSDLVALRGYVGSYPHGSYNFLEQGPLAVRLQRMLGEQYPVLLANLRTVSPLEEEQGRWFISGNRPHEGGAEVAAIVVDAAQNAVRVWLLHDGRQQEFVDPSGAQVPWPQEVQTLLRNASN